MINRVFDQRIIEEIQIDEMGIDRIGNRRYNYMMVAYELGNLGGTFGLSGELGYIRRSHFSKPSGVCKHSRQSARDGGRVFCRTFRVRSLNHQGPTGLFVCTEPTMSLCNTPTLVATAGVATTSG